MKRIYKVLIVTMIITALFAVSISAGVTTKGKNENVEYLKSSFNIKIQNVNPKSIHDTHKISFEEKDYLEKKGYKDQNITGMDFGDYQVKFLQEKIDNQQIDFMLNLYPELKNEKNLESWTNTDCEAYISKINDSLFTPSEKEAAMLINKGLTLDDARYLLKYYDTYSTIITCPDEELIEILEDFYQFKNDYIDYMNYIDESVINDGLLSFLNISAIAATPPSAYIANYRQVASFPYYNYPNDWVHVDAGTHNSYTLLYQANQAVDLFRDIYGTSKTPKFTNIWGAYSAYSKGAHEGIDMVGGLGSTINNPLSGTGTIEKPSTSILVVHKSSRSFFFMHMTNRTTSTTAYSTTNLGKEGNIGNGDGGAHLHFAAELGGETSSTHSATNEHNLDSANPYSYDLY